MLNIENYDQWREVCDDDELIEELYNQGIRPGTDKFVEMLGEPSFEGPPTAKELILVVGVIGLSMAVISGSIKLVKIGCSKLGRCIKKKLKKEKES